MQNVNIATFNVNGIRVRLPDLLQWHEKERPDTVCLRLPYILNFPIKTPNDTASRDNSELDALV